MSNINEKGTGIIHKIDDIGNVLFPLILTALGILNIAGKIPAGVQVAEGIFLIVMPAALTIWNILFPSKKVVDSDEK